MQPVYIILFPVNNLNVELMKLSTYGGIWSGRVRSGQVGPGRVRLLSAIVSRDKVSSG